MINRKYNFVFFEINGLYTYSYSDLESEPNVVMLPHKSKVFGKVYPLYRFHMSKSVNKIVELPFKSLWNPFYFKSSFDNEKPICFVFSGRWVQQSIKTGLLDYYRKKYPSSKMVWFCQDILKKQKRLYGGKELDYAKEIFPHFDLVVGINHEDCERYGIEYHPLVFSSFHGIIEPMPLSDVYFLGKAKNRLPEILSVYEKLRDEGLNLDFHIVGVSPGEQVYANEIHYSEGMSYEQNLQHILHTNCLLEIMQHGQDGGTQRTAEAICMDKLLLTNNEKVKDQPYYNARFISVFNDAKNIDRVFLSNIHMTKHVDYHYKEKLSPVELLDFLDERLNRREGWQ